MPDGHSEPEPEPEPALAAEADRPILEQALRQLGLIVDLAVMPMPTVGVLYRLMHANGYPMARNIGAVRYAAICPYGYTHAIIVGAVADSISFDNRWCYHSKTAAVAALEAWDGIGEPKGWHRQPATGRRIAYEDGEYDAENQPVPIGQEYVRW